MFKPPDYTDPYTLRPHSSFHDNHHDNNGDDNNDPPEDEDEEDEEAEEGGDVVHGTQHNDELVPERGHEPYKLEDPKQPERPQHRQPARTALEQLHHTGTEGEKDGGV